MKRQRILHLRAAGFVGGPENQLLRHVQAEADGPYEIYLGTFVGPREGTEFQDAALARGIRTLSLPAWEFGLNSALPALIRELRTRKFSLLCTHGYKADILGTIAGRICRVPVACFLRGWTRQDIKVRIYETMDRLFLRLADRIVCLSENQAQRVRKLHGIAGRIRIVPNAIDLVKYSPQQIAATRMRVRQQFGFPDDCFLVISAGRLSPEKGVAILLQAAAQLLIECPNARFAVFGEGPLRSQLEVQSNRLGLLERLAFYGFVPELREILPAADVLVNPSLSEEAPNIVLEGMAAGIPVVATSVGAVPEIADGGRALSLVAPGNPQAISEAVAALLRSPTNRSQLGACGQARVQEAYSLTAQKLRFHSLYEELISEFAK